jgi:hypothetical protein
MARLAYELWEARGRPIGSPEVDWFHAQALLSVQADPVFSDQDMEPPET